MFKIPPAPPAAPRREPRQARSRARVDRMLAAAAEEFELRGVEAATMTGIAQRAEVPIGSLYQFFPTKAAILGELARRYAEQGQAAVAEALGPDLDAPLPELIERLLAGMSTFHASYRGYSALMDAQSREPEVAAALLALRVGWLQSAEALVGRRAPGLDPAERAVVGLVAAHAVDVIRYLPWCADEGTQKRLLAEAKALLVRYLVPYDEAGAG